MKKSNSSCCRLSSSISNKLCVFAELRVFARNGLFSHTETGFAQRRKVPQRGRKAATKLNKAPQSTSVMMCLQEDIVRRKTMERFLKRHQNRVAGTIAGFDRVLFAGTLRSISYVEGLEIFLTIQRVLFKDFRQFVEKLSTKIKSHAEAFAIKHKRPYLYIESSARSKEDIAREIMDRDQITRGLVRTFVFYGKRFSVRLD